MQVLGALAELPSEIPKVGHLSYASAVQARKHHPTPCTALGLQDLLRERRDVPPSSSCLAFYSSERNQNPREFSYGDLYAEATRKSMAVRLLHGFRPGRPVILHLEDHWDVLQWFWAVLLADGLPVLGTHLSNVDEHRRKHLQGLSMLLQTPLCITTRELEHLFFDDHCGLRLVTTDFLYKVEVGGSRVDHVTNAGVITSQCRFQSDDSTAQPAILMLTSGSTGAPKAVALSHEQVLAAVKGKASVRALPAGRPFLNWIGLNHVASLVEIHIQALWLGVGQVHVATSDIVSSPRLFLHLLSRHRISRSFAPNFFLAKLAAVCPAEHQHGYEHENEVFDLSDLSVLASGGEANPVKTCQDASALLAKYGAPSNVIVTGFGMTETCAGAIFNLDCPAYDVEAGHAFASLGKCMDGIEMRTTKPPTKGHGAPLLVPEGEVGDLEVRGRVVFQGYYRNPEATAEAFTPDGWFRTGDRASIGRNGNLRLIGRAKDVVNINGVKIASSEIEASLEQSLTHHVSRVIVFPSRGQDTDQITVAYVPKTWPLADAEMAVIQEVAVRACVLTAASRPLVFPLSENSRSLLPHSTLGKIPQLKMTSLFESGAFDKDVELQRDLAQRIRSNKMAAMGDGATLRPAVPTKLERDLAWEFCELLGWKGKMDLDATVFEMGMTSVDLIKLQRRISIRLGMHVPIVVLMTNPTVRALAAALNSSSSSSFSSPPSSTSWGNQPGQTALAWVDYDPVVTFKSSGTKTPLWLVHPGVGEVLVFTGLAQHLRDEDRPIYALRARGFEPGQASFGSVEEAVETYVRAVRGRQPKGPYALAGYSYGTMIAFEMAKKLNMGDDNDKGGGGGDAVRFLGGLNLPPHIKTRMRQLNWNMSLLHLALFLGLVPEEWANAIDEDSAAFRGLGRGEAMAQVAGKMDGGRLEELGLSYEALSRWAEVAFGLQSMAAGYEPTGTVGTINIFHAVPLKAVAASCEEWMRHHLSKWMHFSQTAPRFHAVGGAHYTMIDSEHVLGFSRVLKEAMRSRGV